jgi:uncharacterized protein (TIGR00251 family)
MKSKSYITERQDGITLSLKVVPNSSRNSMGLDKHGRLLVRLAAPPVEGKANKELVKFLAKTLRLPQSAVTILHGKSSREKAVLITGCDNAYVFEKIGCPE